MQVPGRLHSVTIFHKPKQVEDYVVVAIQTAVQILACEAPGDILVVSTGEEQIENSCRGKCLTTQNLRDLDVQVEPVTVLPMYSALPALMQQKIFEAASGNKIVVSTNVVEATLSKYGIIYVVDPGLVTQKVYNPGTRVKSLLDREISRANADQRVGPAGRTRPGKCFSLCSEKQLNENMQAQTHPEILQINLGNAVLMLNLGFLDYVFKGE